MAASKSNEQIALRAFKRGKIQGLKKAIEVLEKWAPTDVGINIIQEEIQNLKDKPRKKLIHRRKS